MEKLPPAITYLPFVTKEFACPETGWDGIGESVIIPVCGLSPANNLV
jgi:hypothetical protein